MAQRPEWIYRGSLIAGCAAIQLAYSATHLRFRADPLQRYAQFLDPALLQDRLLESLWWLHSQPPLLNFLAGLALKVAPANPAAPLGVLFALCGLASCCWLAGTLRRLGFPRVVAASVGLFYVATPPFVLYQNWFFYPHLGQTLLLGVAYCFTRAEGTAGRWLAGGFWTFAALVALRSFYHPIFLLFATAAVVALASRGQRGRALRLAAGPVAVVLALGLKNLWLFGFFGTSSWGGNSFHRMMTESLGRAVVERMVHEGTLSPVSLEWEFSPPEKYVALLAPVGGDRGVPAVDAIRKERGKCDTANYNHWVYPIASREYAAGALRMLREHPGAYLRSIAWTTRRYFDAIGDDEFIAPIRFWIRKVADPWDAFEGSVGYRALLALGLFGVLVGALRPSTAAHERLFLVFAAGTILWVSAAGIC
ncbi:MAG: hypothetical protein ACRDGR_00495, partial [bacterium]